MSESDSAVVNATVNKGGCMLIRASPLNRKKTVCLVEYGFVKHSARKDSDYDIKRRERNDQGLQFLLKGGFSVVSSMWKI